MIIILIYLVLLTCAWIYVAFRLWCVDLGHVISLVADRFDRGVQLRDAITGMKIGMTKRQLKRSQLTLGTKDHNRIAREVAAIIRRKAA